MKEQGYIAFLTFEDGTYNDIAVNGMRASEMYVEANQTEMMGFFQVSGKVKLFLKAGDIISLRHVTILDDLVDVCRFR